VLDSDEISSSMNVSSAWIHENANDAVGDHYCHYQWKMDIHFSNDLSGHSYDIEFSSSNVLSEQL
jgi:hypothetical protein